MLARRIIPCLDVAGGRVVKGVHFESLRDAGDPVEQAARYDAEGADELVFLDISASPDERRTTLEMVARVAPAEKRQDVVERSRLPRPGEPAAGLRGRQPL